MAEFLNRDLRVNEVLSALKGVTTVTTAQVPSPVSGRAFTTLPDGRVLDRFGKVVYTPKVDNAPTRT